jgi:hypothetical protein
MNTYERLSYLDLEIYEIDYQDRLIIDEYVAYTPV